MNKTFSAMMIKPDNKIKDLAFNWPIVGILLFLTSIPAIPAIFILALVIIGPTADANTASFINALYFETPAAILIHGGSGVLFFLTMPFQFSPALRAKCPNRHKIMGRIALLSGCTLGLSGIWLHQVLYPGLYDARYLSLVIMSLAMCSSFILALWHIINGDIQVHRRWMIRAVAITLAAVTPLFIDALVSLLFSQLENIFSIIKQFQHNYDRLLALVINLTIVEWCFFKERTKQNLLAN